MKARFTMDMRQLALNLVVMMSQDREDRQKAFKKLEKKTEVTPRDVINLVTRSFDKKDISAWTLFESVSRRMRLALASGSKLDDNVRYVMDGLMNYLEKNHFNYIGECNAVPYQRERYNQLLVRWLEKANRGEFPVTADTLMSRGTAVIANLPARLRRELLARWHAEEQYGVAFVILLDSAADADLIPGLVNSDQYRASFYRWLETKPSIDYRAGRNALNEVYLTLAGIQQGIERGWNVFAMGATLEDVINNTLSMSHDTVVSEHFKELLNTHMRETGVTAYTLKMRHPSNRNN